MRTSNTKMIFLFFSILFIMCLVIGIVFAKANYEESIILHNYIFDFKQLNSGNLFINIGVFSSSLILSFLGIGIIVLIFYFCYQIFTLGFVTYLLLEIAGIKGFIFLTWYVLITKLLFILLFISLFFYIFRITKLFILAYFKKETIDSIKLFFLIKRSLIIITFVLFNDIILYFFGESLMGVMVNLLKI